MITDNLIRLIESGQAQYKVHTIGIGGSSAILVPKNNYIVIIDFSFSHFIDRPLIAPEDLAQLMDNSVHFVEFRSKGNAFSYCMRTNFLPVLNKYVMPVNNAEQYNTYQLHKTDCHIDIWRMEPRNSWTYTYGILPDKTNEDSKPTGYGTIAVSNANTLLDFRFAGFIVYYPFGALQSQNGDTFYNTFRCPITSFNALIPIDSAFTGVNYTYPIVNIGYVLVNHPFDKNNR